MLTEIHPKLPMRNKIITLNFYTTQLKFKVFGNSDHEDYLMIQKDNVQIHFFLHKDLNHLENYGQVYIRTEDIKSLYNSFVKEKVQIHPAGHLQIKPWGQIEFSILDPDNNLLTFGQSVV